MVFRIASSPYTHNQRQTSRIMMLVCWRRAGHCRSVLVFRLGNRVADSPGLCQRLGGGSAGP
jgi:hypothetical protein